MADSETIPSLRSGFGTRWASAAALLVLIGALVLLSPPVYRRLGPQVALWVCDLAVVLIALVGGVLSAILWRSFGRGEVSRTIWASLTIGLLLWTLGEVIWAVDQLLLNQSLPQPSAADAAWVLGYVPLTLGMYLRYRSYRIPLRTAWHAALLIAAALALGVITVILVLPELHQTPDSRWLGRAVNILYPVGDLLVAYWAILIVSGLAGGTLFSPWRLIAAGYLCVTVSDLIFAYTVRLGLYQVSPASGLNLPTIASHWLYLASYLSIALGTYFHARLQRAL
ncbi:MAG: hypothetical protein AB1449_04725 [Chloroflexota bacterium]